MGYLFLTTLQSLLLKHREPASSKSGRWLRRVQDYFRPLRADHVEPPIREDSSKRSDPDRLVVDERDGRPPVAHTR